VRGVVRQGGLKGRISEMKRYAMPLLVGSLRKAAMMVMSMEARAFGAYPQRTFVEAPRMKAAGMAVSLVMLVLVVAWYGALMLGYVHSFYVFAPA
jgi:energy-coupling factor transport system permease protein